MTQWKCEDCGIEGKADIEIKPFAYHVGSEWYYLCSTCIAKRTELEPSLADEPWIDDNGVLWIISPDGRAHKDGE